jgi:asparagine synthetase B (glutamine-hydrolysing)
MCSFLFARTSSVLSDATLADANRLARHRGPDRTNVHRLVGRTGHQITLLHNLLDMSGNAFPQPVTDPAFDRIYGLFNGEIYNFRSFGDFHSDTQCLLPAAQKFGRYLPRHLDGEFAAVIYDAYKDHLSLFTDPFMTKPMFIGRRSGSSDFAVATCPSTLQGIGCTQIEMAQPNTSYDVEFSGSFSIRQNEDVVEFLLDQHKTNYDDWTAAFLNAVAKRARHGAHRPLVFLSSGYDSGAICLALNLLGIEYDTLSIFAGEDHSVLNKRICINKAHSCRRASRVSGLTSAEIARMSADIREHVEPFEYVHEDQPGVVGSLQTDGGAVGANYLAGLARRNQQLVNLSGSGADEIMSDYGFAGTPFYHHSQFGGRFPADLREIFPWRKFYGDTQRSYLFKDEFVLGRHGLEGRYPFLDKQVVQEFLWLSPELKNNSYKGAIEAFFVGHNYPFDRLKKRGFSPGIQGSRLRRFLKRILK